MDRIEAAAITSFKKAVAALEPAQRVEMIALLEWLEELDADDDEPCTCTRCASSRT